MAPKRDTPAMRQYKQFKERHPDCLLFFRMGDFYELFFEDAVTAHKALGITLTKRTEGVPMAGVPYHSADGYLARLIAQGFRVAVCDQIQDPKEAKGIVERAVTRVITPGTLIDDALLEGDAPNTLACVSLGDREGEASSYCLVELSTGEFHIGACPEPELIDELARAGVRELLYCETEHGDPPASIEQLRVAIGVPATARPSWHFRPAEALEALTEHYKVRTLSGFGIEDGHPGVRPAGVTMRYLHETQATERDGTPTSEGASSGTAFAQAQSARRSLAHLSPIRLLARNTHMAIDAPTLRALEIERTIRGGQSDGSLLGIFARIGGKPGCATPMGRRLLRDWLTAPCVELTEIERRQSCVATLIEDARTHDELAERLEPVQDVPRIVARVGLGRATPRDIVALGQSLAALAPLRETLTGASAFADDLIALDELREALAPLADSIVSRCVESPPSHMREGGLFSDGIDTELDESRSLERDASSHLAAYQKQLIDDHGLPNLKVGYNRVFGYYIELPAAQAMRAPDTFTRKQTLKNAERYITPELKEFEEKVLDAGERAVRREQLLFGELCEAIASVNEPANRFARSVARLDALSCFAHKARRHGWTRPEMLDSPDVQIVQGRHPVLDEIDELEFVPNDVRLGATDDAGEPCARLALITGPNMAGKSTYIRQVALLTILAHTGSFVPAESAQIGLTDRVFARIGADDALHLGRSTFMVEMIETANILNNATDRSLVILDEIGRGTSTLDGLSLAWAIAEHLARIETHDSPEQLGPRTLFATHYHELTDLADLHIGRIANLHVAVREWGESIVFLHRILPGRTNSSYGIHVAKLAGMPESVSGRAGELLDSLSVARGSETTAREAVERTTGRAPSDQLSLFTEFVPHPAIERLRELKLESMSPLEAFDALREIRANIENGRAHEGTP